MASTVEVRKIFIKSETDQTKTYSIHYFLWNNDTNPREIVCSCLGYKYRGKCKHIEIYDPCTSDLWKHAKSI